MATGGKATRDGEAVWGKVEAGTCDSSASSEEGTATFALSAGPPWVAV